MEQEMLAHGAQRFLTFGEFLDLHWDDFVERSKLRDSTREGYTSMLNNWMRDFFGEMRMVSINKETVSAYGAGGFNSSCFTQNGFEIHES
jgi:hypothetical protein